MSKLRALLGPVMFNDLCDRAGGTRVYLPQQYGKPPTGGRDTRRRLDRLFGPSLAVLLVFHFGGSSINVPRRAGGFNKRRVNREKFEADLARLSRTKLSTNSVARRVGCDRRTVEKHRARNRLNGKVKG